MITNFEGFYPVDGYRLDGGVVLRLETKNINLWEQQSIVFCHVDFKGLDFYAVQSFYRIETEGHSDHFFQENTEEGEDKPLEVGNLDQMEGEVLTPEISELIIDVAGHHYLESINIG